jgi:hypothetical protein
MLIKKQPFTRCGTDYEGEPGYKVSARWRLIFVPIKSKMIGDGRGFLPKNYIRKVAGAPKDY